MKQSQGHIKCDNPLIDQGQGDTTSQPGMSRLHNKSCTTTFNITQHTSWMKEMQQTVLGRKSYLQITFFSSQHYFLTSY